MLSDFVSADFAPDDETLEKVKYIINSYKRQRRLLTKSANANSKTNNKDKRHNVFEVQNEINIYYRNEVLDLIDGDLQLAFDYLMAAANGDEKTVWNILDDAIIPIIKKRKTV